jgi:hypothetical protein
MMAERVAERYQAAAVQPAGHVKPGKYVHFKGGRYRVLFTAFDSETEKPVVVYLNAKNQAWVRPEAMWNELTDKWPDGIRRPRFIPESEAPDNLPVPKPR